MIVPALHNQSLIDVAVQHTGSASNAILLAIANNISVTAMLVPGQEITVPDTIEIDNDIVQYFSNKNIKLATANFEAISNVAVVDVGIGQMIIEDSFIVE